MFVATSVELQVTGSNIVVDVGARVIRPILVDELLFKNSLSELS
jgi:hypothetical protein